MPAELDVLPPTYNDGRSRMVLWRLPLNEEHHQDQAVVDAVQAFLTAHGIDPNRVPVQTTLWAEPGDGDQPLLYVYRWVLDQDGGPKVCPNCVDCMQMELVRTPLVTPVSGLPAGDPIAVTSEVFRRALFGDDDA